MSDIFEKLEYTSDECKKLNMHIDEVLKLIDPSKINGEYSAALEKGERARAISALAAYYRGRPDFFAPTNGKARAYNKQYADNTAEGKMREIDIDYDFGGKRINFLFNPTVENPPLNHEWLWHLNRHYWWADMARAYDDTKDEKYAEAFNVQMLDWVAQTDIPEAKWNDPGSAFRTIECGHRLRGSWQVAFDLFRKSKSVADETIIVMLGSMHRQAMHLMAHPTWINWLLIETNGLYDFASFFGEFSDAESIRQASCEKFIDEIRRQVLPDGLQFELSPGYHFIALKCVEKIYRTAVSTGRVGELPQKFFDCIYDMVMGAVKISSPAFIQPKTNDTGYELASYYTGGFAKEIFKDEPVFKFVNTERREGEPPKGETASVYMPWAGFAAMRSDWNADASYLCFDVGPLGKAHGHQDKLNIILFKGNEELIFDDGGGDYEISPKRTYGISAYDHNTVTVDGKGQSRKEPKVSEAPIDAGWISNGEFDYAYGIYDDEFEGEIKPATHKREVRFCKPSFFVVRDTLESADGEAHTYGVRFHTLAEKISLLQGGSVLAEYGKIWDLLIVPLFDEGEFSENYTVHSAETDPHIGWYIGKGSYKNLPAKTLIMQSAPAEVHHFTNILIPFMHGSELPTVTRGEGDNITVQLSGGTFEFDISALDK